MSLSKCIRQGSIVFIKDECEVYGALWIQSLRSRDSDRNHRECYHLSRASPPWLSLMLVLLSALPKISFVPIYRRYSRLCMEDQYPCMARLVQYYKSFQVLLHGIHDVKTWNQPLASSMRQFLGLVLRWNHPLWLRNPLSSPSYWSNIPHFELDAISLVPLLPNHGDVS